MPRISIILPVFNGEAFLAECVDSVLAQNPEDFELLAGDDGSSDRSRAILASYCDSRLKVYLNERNVGLFANLNRLTARATAPLVRFLCQDDALEPGCLAHEVASMEANEKIVMTICSVYEIDSQSRVTGGWDTTGGPIVFHSLRCIQRLFYEGCITGTLSTVCVRRRVLEAAGPFNETYAVSGDYEMWVRVCRHGSVSELRARLIRQRQHEGRLSMAPFSGVRCVRENRRVIEQIIPLCRRRIVPARDATSCGSRTCSTQTISCAASFRADWGSAAN